MGVGNSTERKWIVLLEVADEAQAGSINPPAFGRLTELCADTVVTAVCSPDRYALQFTVEAAGPDLALSSVLWRWKDAVRRAGLPEWALVRAELLTPDELERDISVAERPADEGRTPQMTAIPSNAVEDELLRRALYDGHTGLPGREVFVDDLRRALTTHGDSPATKALLIVGLDGFPSAGGTRSPASGDATLIEMASRLASSVRGADLVARIGDEELAVLLEVRTAEQLEGVAERIVDRLRIPVLVEGRPVAVRVSVGMAMVSEGIDPDSLMLTVEKAMWSASDGRRQDVRSRV